MCCYITNPICLKIAVIYLAHKSGGDLGRPHDLFLFHTVPVVSLTSGGGGGTRGCTFKMTNSHAWEIELQPRFSST